MTAKLQSQKRQKKLANQAATLTASEHAGLITRIWNLFELERCPTERIAEAVDLPRSELIRIIQTSTPKKTEAL